MAPRYMEWKLTSVEKWLLIYLFLNGKAFALNKTNKTYIIDWNFQAVTVV
jgi:hypothetical protein